MKLLLALLVSSTYLNTVTSQGCSKIVTRREIRDLSDYERTSFFNAVKQLHQDINLFEGFSIWHQVFNNDVHLVPALLPWHRWFIYLFEKKLQEIDPMVSLPYWDWTRDYRSPERSIIFSNDYFGGNGRGSDLCVVNGVFSNWDLVTPNNHCLKRDFEYGSIIPPFASPEIIEVIIDNSDSYDEFRVLLEYSPHALIHNGVGGIGGDMSKAHAPNDPLFFLHHSFIDLIWSEWQTRHPTMANTYNGNQVTSSDTLPPFDIQVKDTFNTTDLCYKYPRFSAKLPIIRRTTLDHPHATNKTIEHRNFVNFNTTVPLPFTKLNNYIYELHHLLPKSRSSTPSPNLSNDDMNTKIIHPDPLPEHFIKDMKMDIEKVRSNELLIKRLVDAINRVNGFKASVNGTD